MSSQKNAGWLHIVTNYFLKSKSLLTGRAPLTFSFGWRKNPREAGQKPEQSREQNKRNPQIASSPGQIGGTRVLSPLTQPWSGLQPIRRTRGIYYNTPPHLPILKVRPDTRVMKNIVFSTLSLTYIYFRAQCPKSSRGLKLNLYTHHSLSFLHENSMNSPGL